MKDVAFIKVCNALKAMTLKQYAALLNNIAIETDVNNFQKVTLFKKAVDALESSQKLNANPDANSFLSMVCYAAAFTCATCVEETSELVKKVDFLSDALVLMRRSFEIDISKKMIIEPYYL